MSKYGFRELFVWQRAKELAVNIYKATEHGALDKDWGLKDQLRRSAVSVPSNIAEGDERETDRESVRFFYIAKGSLGELVTQIEIAKDVGHLSQEEISPLLSQCTEIGKMLGSLIKTRSRFRFKTGLFLLTLTLCLTTHFLL